MVYQIRPYGIPRLASGEAKDAGNNPIMEKFRAYFQPGTQHGLCIISFHERRAGNTHHGRRHKIKKHPFLESKIKCSQGMN
jgi:hypothetical protein